MVYRKYKVTTFGETKRLISINENLIEPLLFLEKLYVYNENGNRIGRFSLKVEKEDGNTSEPKIIFVHISNRALINGKLSETIVTGTVTTKFKTLEEIRYECTEMSDKEKHERTMFMLREMTKYYLSITNTICSVKNQSHLSIPFAESLGLIGESANAFLLRVLALKGYQGILCLKTVLSNGKRCRNYYVCKLSQQIVNKKKIQVLVVYRTITNHKKCNITMTLALTRAGQLIYLFWSNVKYFLHVDPNIDINPKRFFYNSVGLSAYWNKDIQLHSLYLDRVDQNRMMCRSYKYENEALKRLLGDFVEYVLLIKPKDILCFAIKYFTSFSHDHNRICGSTTRMTPEYFEDTLPEGIAENLQEEDYRCFDATESGILFGE